MSLVPDVKVASASAAKDAVNRTGTNASPVSGQLVVVKFLMDSGGDTPSISDNLSLTWTLQTSKDAGSSFSSLYIWTATTTGTGSQTVTIVGATVGNERWTSAEFEWWPTGCTVGGIGTALTGTGAPTVNITTTGTGSAISACNGDWNAVTNTTRTYRGTSPTEESWVSNSTTGGAYGAEFWYTQAASAGTVAAGMTAPTGQKYTLAALEVLAASGGGGSAATPAPFNFTRPAVQRASTW